MYNNPYMGGYNPQPSIDRINSQMAELEKMKMQLQQPMQQVPTNLTQNFQLAPTNNNLIKHAESLEEVEKNFVLTTTPYFSKDMSILWIKEPQGEVKTYELREIIKKDEKDLQIEFLKARIDELEKGMSNNAEPNDEYVDEPTKSEKPSDVSNDKSSKTKSGKSNGNVSSSNK